MHSTAYERELFRGRRRRSASRGRWLVLALVALIAAASTAWLALTPSSDSASESGVGSQLEWVAIPELPTWAMDAVHDLQLGTDYQFVATVVDLNRDEQPEILLAPAPARSDVFIAESPLRVLLHVNGRWEVDEADRSCRPHEIGSFLTEDYWDLRCRDAHGRHVMRWNGSGYRSRR